MNPVSIKARNYRTFETLDLDFPTGCVAILGPNGAGKSSVANTVDLALFGPDGRSWAPYLTQGSESTELMLELVFEHGDEVYRVRRGFSARGSGKTTLDLERWATHHPGGPSDDFWTPLTRETAKATQAFLETLLGMTRETFRASSMLVQGDGAAFTEAAPADRKRVLAKILGLDRYDRLQELAKRDRKAGEAELQKIAGALEAADREIEGKDERVASRDLDSRLLDEARARLSEDETELATLAQTVRASAEREQARQRALADVTAATGRLEPLRQKVADAEQAAEDLRILQDELESLPTGSQIEELEKRGTELAGRIEAHRQDVIRAEEAERAQKLKLAERDAMLGQSRATRERAAGLANRATAIAQGHVDNCPTCEQALGVDARSATISALNAQAIELDLEASAIAERADALEIPEIPTVAPLTEGLEEELTQTRERFRQARDGELQKARLEGRAEALRATVAARPAAAEIVLFETELVVARQAFDAMPPRIDVDDERARIVVVDARLREGRGQVEVFAARVAVHAAALERIENLEATTADARRQRSAIQKTIDELVILERAYGRDGIPALIIGQAAIPSIETEAGRILGELGTSYRVELRTEKALATGAIADALDVVVVTEDGERPYETFSGGERTRINLALRIGLARLLAHRRGAESRLLVIDEPEYLDQAGTAALATVLRGLTGDFDRIYLISHVPELRDAALDSVIEVSRTDAGLSQIGGIA